GPWRVCSRPTSRSSRAPTTRSTAPAMGCPWSAPPAITRSRWRATPWGGRELPRRQAGRRGGLRRLPLPLAARRRDGARARRQAPLGVGHLLDQRADERGRVSPLAFARALLARWDRRVAAPRPLGLVFRAPPRPGRPPRTRAASAAPALPRLRQSVRVDLRPAISLTVLRPEATSHALSPLRTEPAEPGGELPRLERLVIRDRGALAGERLVERLLSRSRPRSTSAASRTR